MTDPVLVGALAGAGFLAGSVPFALLVGRIALGVDPRAYGDGNPGATNVGRAGGRRLGFAAAVLDIAKGVVPAGLAVDLGLDGAALAVALVAPVAGHVWSPWLRFRGGKGTATAYGVLIPVSLPAGPVLMPLALVAAYRLLEPDGWAPVIGLVALLLWLLPGAPDPGVLGAIAGIGAILVVRYRTDLAGGLRRRRRPTARTPVAPTGTGGEPG